MKLLDQQALGGLGILIFYEAFPFMRAFPLSFPDHSPSLQGHPIVTISFPSYFLHSPCHPLKLFLLLLLLFIFYLDSSLLSIP
jgi:hypothetical protein